jgi:hypothetical protein
VTVIPTVASLARRAPHGALRFSAAARVSQRPPRHATAGRMQRQQRARRFASDGHADQQFVHGA